MSGKAQSIDQQKIENKFKIKNIILFPKHNKLSQHFDRNNKKKKSLNI